jgi:hypothetical protein
VEKCTSGGGDRCQLFLCCFSISFIFFLSFAFRVRYPPCWEWTRDGIGIGMGRRGGLWVALVGRDGLGSLYFRCRGFSLGYFLAFFLSFWATASTVRLWRASLGNSY